MSLSVQKQRLAVVSMMLLWCLALLFVRSVMSNGFWWHGDSMHDKGPLGLTWNLFLAVVPMFWSSIFRVATASQRWWLSGTSFCLWLLFLPNAPYLLTDLVHLEPRANVPFWFLLAMLLSCAGAGAMLGYFSLIEIHTVVEKQWNKALGWLVVIGSMLLSGFGIYLGRFLRWNSWDALTHPRGLIKVILRQLADPGPHPHPVTVTLVYGIGLIIGYLALRVMASAMRTQ